MSAKRSGAAMYSAFDAAALAAGPDVIRGSGPNHFARAYLAHGTRRVLPIDGLDRFASMSSSPLQFGNATGYLILPIAKPI
jgi:hypothetical protein